MDMGRPVMAVATSIDAMAAGVNMGTMGFAPGANIWVAIALIGGFTFCFCGLGVRIGSFLGAKLEKKSQILGGAILILLPMTASRLVFTLCGIAVMAIGGKMLYDRLRSRRWLEEQEDPNIIDAL